MTALQEMHDEFRRARIARIREALRAEGGNRTRAARRLGYKHASDLFRAMATLGIDYPGARTGRPKGLKWSKAERAARERRTRKRA